MVGLPFPTAIGCRIEIGATGATYFTSVDNSAGVGARVEVLRGELAHDRRLDLKSLEQRPQSLTRTAIETIHTLREDQLVLGGVLPADELGHRDLIAMRLE